MAKLSHNLDEAFKPLFEYFKSEEYQAWQRHLVEAQKGVASVIARSTDEWRKRLDELHQAGDQ